MDYHRLGMLSPYLILGFGAVLFLIAVIHHGAEFYAFNGVVGPMVALLLDGLPALGLAYAGYWLAGSDLPSDGRWRACIWCFGGATLFVAVMGLSLLVRLFEGRVIGEPLFPLLIAAEAGAIAGVIAGYYTGRARVEARRAQAMSDALAIVNSLIRHDLRNDLNVIQGHLDVLGTGAGPTETETKADSLSIIAEKTDEALARIDTTGAVADTLIGDADLDEVDLAAITAEIATRIETTYDVSVTIDVPDRALVTANAGLRSVVDNVLENAVEHNDADDPRIRVAVETNTETTRLRVADNGPGISDEQKKLILDSTGGDGGGLSLVQILVEGYGGEVGIEDNDPRGSIVTVELPRTGTEQQ